MSKLIHFGRTFRCWLPYSDGYANYKITDKFVPERAGVGNGVVWVYSKDGNPIPLEVLVHCFKEEEAQP